MSLVGRRQFASFSRDGAMVSKLVHCWRENGLALGCSVPQDDQMDFGTAAGKLVQSKTQKYLEPEVAERPTHPYSRRRLENPRQIQLLSHRLGLVL